MARLKAEKDCCMVLAKGKKHARSALAGSSGISTGSRFDSSCDAEAFKRSDYQKVGEAISFCFQEKSSKLLTKANRAAKGETN